MSGNCLAMASTRSSQYGIVMEMPLDLVADVRCFFGRLDASSNAYLSTRSMPKNLRPPIDEYSPSVFSRTTQKSMSPGLRLASGHGTPGISRTGRRLTYWSNSRRNFINEPHKEMWSGILAGQPTEIPDHISLWG